MPIVKLSALRAFVTTSLRACGLSPENADIVTDTVLRASLRGVGHHDIYDFGGRLTGLQAGKFAANPVYEKLAAFGGMESWDGGNGLGELTCSFAMERAMALADVHGMGFCAIRHSNHYLAAAPYVERAAERGYIALLLCKGPPTMGAPDRTDKPVGALPMGFAFPTDHGYPVMLDVCMAYASFGLLKEKMDRNQSVPAHWGYDEDGAPTTDPARMAKGTRLPIGGHKGFGLSVLGEVLTGLLSHGCIIDEEDTVNGQPSPTSHTAIALKADALLPLAQFNARTGEMLDRMEQRAPGLHIPGQGSFAKRQAMEAADGIDLSEALLAQLNAQAEKLGIPPLG